MVTHVHHRSRWRHLRHVLRQWGRDGWGWFALMVLMMALTIVWMVYGLAWLEDAFRRWGA